VGARSGKRCVENDIRHTKIVGDFRRDGKRLTGADQIIILPRGEFTVVDADDYAMVSKHRFRVRGGYAITTIDGRTVGLHRLILDAKPGQTVDHIDGNPLNNRRSNLRFCTHTQNMHNRRKDRGGNTSKFKGVHFAPHVGKWIAKIGYQKKQQHIGCFDTEEAAAQAYDQRALDLFGKFAKTNLPCCFWQGTGVCACEICQPGGAA